MIDRLKKYLDEELKEVKDSREMREIKDELLANLVDKYEEMLHLGYSEDQAFIEAVKSIGDINEIIKRNHEDPSHEGMIFTHYFSLYTMISIGLIVFGLLLFFLVTLVVKNFLIGLVIQISIILIASFIFNNGLSQTNQMNNKILSKELKIRTFYTMRTYTELFLSTIFFSLLVPFLLNFFLQTKKDDLYPIFFIVISIPFLILIFYVDVLFHSKINHLTNNETKYKRSTQLVALPILLITLLLTLITKYEDPSMNLIAFQYVMLLIFISNGIRFIKEKSFVSFSFFLTRLLNGINIYLILMFINNHDQSLIPTVEWITLLSVSFLLISAIYGYIYHALKDKNTTFIYKEIKLNAITFIFLWMINSSYQLFWDKGTLFSKNIDFNQIAWAYCFFGFCYLIITINDHHKTISKLIK